MDQPSRVAARDGIAPAGVVLGLGLGGFVDGIVLHQILQWHHLVSETHPVTGLDDLELNTLADGLFHAATWVFVVVGVALLLRAVHLGAWRRGWRSLFGWALVGWGVFNLVEGIVNHHLLGIHRVRPAAANPLVWDLGFLALGVLLVTLGWLLQRSDTRAEPVAAPPKRSSSGVASRSGR